MSEKFKPCSIDGCGGNAYSGGRGWCGKHYSRWSQHGHPLGGGPFRASPGEPMRFLEETVLTYRRDDCLTWPYCRDRQGYARIDIEGNFMLAQRVICERVHGPAPTKDHQAAHSCGMGTSGCINPGHLSWKTCAENHADKLIHGTHSRGEQQGASKLTEAQVLEIRRLTSEGQLLQKEIAKSFGVTISTISKIHRRKKWAWLVG